MIRHFTRTRLDIFRDAKLKISYNIRASNLLQKKLHELDMKCGGPLVTKSIVPEEDRKSYLLSSLMEEAIASSQLEGAATSRSVAKEMLKTNRKPRNPDEKMIWNNYLTMKYIVESKEKQLTPKFIQDLHARITEETLDKMEWEGRFRENDDVRVYDKETGEIFHTPPSHEKIPGLIQNYCEFANKTDHKAYIHPIIKASILHFLMGYLHPFEDGNGRTARSIFYWYLLSQGYWLIQFMAVSRFIKDSPAKYSRAYLYAEQDANDVTYFIKFQIESIEKAHDALMSYIRKKTEEKKELYSLIQIPGINERQALILLDFANDPKTVMDIHQMKERFSVVYQTARVDLLQLAKKGLLKQKTSGKKLLFFRSQNFDDVLKASR